MDRRERIGELDVALRAALHGFQAGLWTAIPAIIQSFDASAETCTAQPTIQARVRDKDGTYSWVNLPLLVDVPVHFPCGGGYTLTFPVAKGDEALIVFSSRCIDHWWQSGGVQPQAELRMHDLSDGFAFVGFRSKPRVLSGVSTNTVQLRADDGASYVELAAGHVCNVVAPGGINLAGPVNITGSVAHSGGTFVSNGINYATHKHTGVQTGGGTSGGPTA